MSSHSVELRLLDQKITLKTEADPTLVREVVDLVSKKLKEAEQGGKNVLPHYVTLIALLDLAQEYVQAKKRAGDHIHALNEKSQELTRLIEAELKG